ncbi:MAG: hypothetical protein JSW41_03030, partial [Candidatus Aenigmatarchaeota archaeon]
MSRVALKSELDAHKREDWRLAHNILKNVKEYVPGWGYSKVEIDAMWEGYTPAGKGKVSWNSLTGKPSTFPPSSHTHSRSDITNFWAESFWANIPDKPSTFPPSAHKSSHEVGGGDLINHDNLTGFVGNEHIDWTNASQQLLTSGGVQTRIFMAYGTAAAGSPLYRLKPYGVDDDSFVRWLDKDGGDEWSIGTQSHQASWIIRRESGTPANLVVVDRTTGKVTASVELDTPKLTIGSYYLDSLIANNKVPDSDKLDGQEGSYYAPTTTKLDDWGIPDDNTDLDARTSRHGVLPKLGGGTSNFLRADGAWAVPVAAAHAPSHESGGGDTINHDSLVGFVGNEHIDWTGATQVLNTSGGIQTPIFMAYGISGSGHALYRLKPYGTEDDSFVRWLDNTGSDEWSIGTQSHQASWIIRRESGTPINCFLVDRTTGKVTA